MRLQDLIAAATGSTCDLLWLNEDGGHDVLAKGLTLEDAFGRLMACANLMPTFERIDGAMTLFLDDGPYRVTSANPDDQEATREIMRAGVAHCWGEYQVTTSAA